MMKTIHVLDPEIVSLITYDYTYHLYTYYTLYYIILLYISTLNSNSILSI